MSKNMCGRPKRASLWLRSSCASAVYIDIPTLSRRNCFICWTSCAHREGGGDPAAQGYGPTNLIALLRELRGHLRQLDLSHLFIRGAYLQGVEMQDTSLAGATLRDTIFTETFDAIWTVAVSSHGQYWAAGSRQGEVRVWCEDGRILHLIWQAHTDNLYFLTFSPDERLLATASWDGTIKLWDLNEGACSGQASIPTCSDAWSFPLMAICSPVAGMPVSSNSGMWLPAQMCRRCQIRWSYIRAGLESRWQLVSEWEL